MRRFNIIFRFMFCALLCLSALNISSWRIALSIHEVDEHWSHSPISSDSWHKPGHNHTHGVCHICELFNQHKPQGTGSQILPPALLFIAFSLIPAASIHIPSPIEQGYPIRAPPLV